MMKTQLAESGGRRHSKGPLRQGILTLVGTVTMSLLACAGGNAAYLHAKRTPQQATPGPRFDNLVRGDMFAGMAGDQTALARAMKLCEETLAKNPNHAEALVWHGSGDYFLAGVAFRQGDFQRGAELFSKGLKEMDDAVALQPESISVLIPRGATLLEGSKHLPDLGRAKEQLEKALDDYGKVLAAQKEGWEKLPEHARGELLSGLAEGWYRHGNQEKARMYFKQIVTELKGTGYATRADAVLDAAEPPKQLNWRCMGCHVAGAFDSQSPPRNARASTRDF